MAEGRQKTNHQITSSEESDLNNEKDLEIIPHKSGLKDIFTIRSASIKTYSQSQDNTTIQRQLNNQNMSKSNTEANEKLSLSTSLQQTSTSGTIPKNLNMNIKRDCHSIQIQDTNKKMKLNTNEAKISSVINLTPNTLLDSQIHPDIQIQNSFDPLVSEMDHDPTQSCDNDTSQTVSTDTTKTTARPKQIRLPPIIVKKLPNGNFFEQNHKLQSLLNQPMKISYSSEGIKYHTSCRSDYDKLYSTLQNENLSFYSYEPRETRLLQVVIKRLPTFIEPSVLKEELQKLNFAVEHVRQMTVPEQSSDGTPMRRPIPVWVVTLPNNEHSRTIYQLFDINNHVIKVESYRPTPHVIQCHKCQNFGHTSRRCNLQTRCVKCSNSHLFSECPSKGPDHTPKCANCGGSHTSSYSQCPVQLQQRRELQEKLRKKRNAQQESSVQHPVWTSSDFPNLPRYYTNVSNENGNNTN